MKNLKPAEAIGPQHDGLRAERHELLNEFLTESREHLDQIDCDLDEMWRCTLKKEMLSSIFRNLHSIKGASGFLGFSKIEGMAHAGESMLGGIRERALVLDPGVIAMLHETVDSIQSMLDSIESTGREGRGDDVELLNKLRRLMPPIGTYSAPSASSCEDGPIASEVVLKATVEDCAKPIGQLLIERAGVPPGAVQAARDLQRLGDPRAMGEILVSQGVVTSVAAGEIVEYQQEARAASVGETSVRVEVKLLDKIVRLAEDIVDCAGRLARLADSRDDPEIGRVNQHLMRIATWLHREAVKTRVQPLAAVEAPLVRLVKDLSNLSGKRVRLESIGTNIRVDRVVLAAIKDPLLHLIRNAVDHGIESPQQRVMAGKPMEGRVRIRATCSERQVVVEVSDDGAGIDLYRVKQLGVQLGVIGRERVGAMTDAEVADLVFLPGFTTARSVSHISGRGVGMDIVKTKVEKIGGSVSLSTRKGLGTTIRLAVPLTPQ